MQRLFLGLLALAWVGSSIGGALHSTLVQHVLCSEHGVIEHADPHTDYAARPPSDRDGGPQIERAFGPTDHGETCLVDAHASDGPILPEPPPLLARIEAVPSERAPPVPVWRPVASTPLSWAPKTSPPRVLPA